MIVKEGDKYVAIVDLGDGSAPQKFYGDTHEELVSKLIQAQTHATKTIKQQKTLIRTTPTPDRGTEVTDRQDLTLEELREITAQQQIHIEAGKFLRAHPDFIESMENDKIVTQYITSRGYDYTAHNLGLAYEDLKDILKLKTVIPSVENSQPSNVTVRNRQASTGLPSNTSVPRSATPKVGLTVKEITEMPTAEYDRRFRDPKFRQLVDEAYAKK